MNKETAAAYRLWMATPVYEDIMEMIEEIKRESVKDEDRISTADLSVQVIAECRGVRKGLTTLVKRIEGRLE